MKYKKEQEIERQVFKDYSKTVIFNKDDFDNTGHLFQTVVIPPNTKQREHYHDEQVEVFYILDGECFIYINGEEFQASPGNAFICQARDKHYLWNKTNNKFKLAVFKYNVPDNDDTHWSEDN